MRTNILWLTTELPDTVHHGGVLRLVNLARELGDLGDSYLVALNGAEGSLEGIRRLGIFKEILVLEPPQGRPNPARHLRWSNTHIAQRGHPKYFRQTAEKLSAWITTREIQVGVAFTLLAAEFLEALPCKVRVVDDYDCVTLTLERHALVGARSRNPLLRLSELIHYWRTRRLEGSLTSRFDLVTTISHADQARLKQLSKTRADAVQVVKNGVEERLLSFRNTSIEERNAVIFWGNLAFPPNYHAVHFFFNEIFKPHLEPRGVRWHIVGARADASIRRLASASEQIELVGFVPDLAAYVSRIPVMVNPMISGSGLKNKVLEAFALRRAVVSTAMGIEAIQAVAGKHYFEADDPENFAAHVTSLLDNQELRSHLTEQAYSFVLSHYRWKAIGNGLRDLIAARLESPRPSLPRAATRAARRRAAARAE